MFGSKTDKIKKLVEKKHSDKLAAFTTDKNEEVRLAAIDGLGACGDDAAYNALVPLVHAPEASTRAHAVRALAKAGNPHARVHIEHQVQQEKDPSVLAAIHDALAVLHGGE